jgi:hypothetical protein
MWFVINPDRFTTSQVAEVDAIDGEGNLQILQGADK